MGRELRICFKIRKKRKHAKAEEFVEEMKKIHEKVEVALRKITGGDKEIYR